MASASDTANDEVLNVRAVAVHPNPAVISAELGCEITFSLSRSYSNARWHMKYLVDSTRKRYLIELVSSEPTSYRAGDVATVRLHVPGIDVTGLKTSHMLNCGLLILTLTGACACDGSAGHVHDPAAADAEVASIQMLVNVTRGTGDALNRVVLNPFAA